MSCTPQARADSDMNHACFKSTLLSRISDCSDLAKAINAPIFHVNADSMEDVDFAFKAAAEYRQVFNHDVVIDLIGYRKMGHNELD